MARRYIYRDYRKGKAGQFASRESWRKSHAQGARCHIHREYLPQVIIDNVRDLFDIQDDDGLDYEEFHATGDTGRRAE